MCPATPLLLLARSSVVRLRDKDRKTRHPTIPAGLHSRGLLVLLKWRSGYEFLRLHPGWRPCFPVGSPVDHMDTCRKYEHKSWSSYSHLCHG